MHISIRQVVNWAAIYAIALRAILLGVTPVVVGGAVAGDPLTIICHSDGQALAPSEQPAAHGNVPGQSCEHCNLCSAVTAPAAPDGILGTILPSQVGMFFVRHRPRHASTINPIPNLRVDPRYSPDMRPEAEADPGSVANLELSD
jgi:hypothetical protein